MSSLTREPGPDATFLADVAGVLFDVDGVLRNASQAVPGAAEVIRTLNDRSVDYCLLTNNSTHSRASLLRELRGIGLEVDEDRLFNAATATASWVARNHPAKRCLVLVAPDAITAFEAAGVEVVGDDDAEHAEVVVMGGAGDHFRYDRLNAAFRALRNGAQFIAVHRNIAWVTDSGLTLDSGPFIAALEQATGARATVVGKPSVPFFQVAIDRIGQPPSRLLMVGDDVDADIAPARALGMKTALVRTGKPIPADPPSDDRSITIDSVASLDWSTAGQQAAAPKAIE